MIKISRIELEKITYKFHLTILHEKYIFMDGRGKETICVLNSALLITRIKINKQE